MRDPGKEVVHLPFPTPNTMLMLIHPKRDPHYSNIAYGLGGSGARGLGKLKNDFPLLNNASGVLSSAPKDFWPGL